MKPSESKENILNQSESLGLIAHEIKSPISATIQMLQAVELMMEDSDQKKVLRMIVRARKRAQSALELTRNLLEYIKINTQKKKIEDSKEFIISKRIPGLLDKHFQQAEARNVRIICEFGCGSAPVSINEFEFDLIADNLISNAIRYSKRLLGEQRVWIRTSHYSSGVIFEVEDEGIGMNEDDKKKIFGGFYRSIQAKEQTISGSGLGLAIVKKIIDEMGATIACSSIIGQGTKFTVTFPNSTQK